MVDIRKSREMRFDFLKRLYDEANGTTSKRIQIHQMKNLSWDREQLDAIIDILMDDGLIECKAFDGVFSLTSLGREEIESIESQVVDTTSHSTFTPVINNITNHIGTMNNSPIQQATINSSQVVEGYNSNTQELAQLFQELRQEISRLNLSEKDRNDVELEIATLENQSKSSRRNITTIQNSGDNIRSILHGVTASAIWQLLAGIISQMSIPIP